MDWIRKNISLNFIVEFRNRDGIAILLSTFLIKILGAILSVIIVRILTKEDYGYISFALSVISSVTVFAGFGANWSMLRFGPLLDSFSKKFSLFKFSITQGSIYTLLLIGVIIIFSFFIPHKLKNAQLYLVILSFSLLSQFLYESFKSYLRIINRNKSYSYANIIGSISIFLLGIGLSYTFDGIGYAFALVLAPLLAFLFFYKRIFIKESNKFSVNKNEFWKYGLYTGIGTIANQMILSLGPIIPAYLNATPQEIALLKVATIIPFNLLIFPGIIMTTDFVHLSKSYLNRIILKKYYFDYIKITVLISVIPFTLFWYFNDEIVVLFFGINYEDSAVMLLVLNVSVFFSFLFRVPLGNILAAVGKANWNVAHTFLWLFLFVPSCFFVYPFWGINGIAYAMAFIFIFSGFISFAMFLYYLKTLKT